MNWKAEKGREQDTLKRIIALLFALAVLAERAAGRSRPVRWLVLWILRHAETVVREFVTGSPLKAAGSRRSPASTAVRHGHDPADAMTLAASLRSLALLVRTIAAQLRRLSFLQLAADEGDHGGRPNHDVFGQLLNMTFPPLERHDTS
jgi:hypothetical protein